MVAGRHADVPPFLLLVVQIADFELLVGVVGADLGPGQGLSSLKEVGP